MAFISDKLSDEEMEAIAMSEPVIREAIQAERIFMGNPDDYFRYVNRQIALMDYRSGMQGAIEEGIRRGIAQGRREGRAEGRHLGITHIAMNMLRAGTPLSTVAQMVELPEAVIRKMAEEHGLQVS